MLYLLLAVTIGMSTTFGSFDVPATKAQEIVVEAEKLEEKIADIDSQVKALEKKREDMIEAWFKKYGIKKRSSISWTNTIYSNGIPIE